MKYIILFGFLTGLIAQNYDWGERKNGRGRGKGKMENMIIWRLTEDLDLTIDQSEKFFPRFREHRKNLEALGKQEREIVGTIDGKKISKNDVKEMIEDISKLRQKRIELESKFVLSLDDILEPDQMIRLGIFKQKMMTEMRNEIRDGKEKKQKNKKDRNRRRRGH